MISLDGKIAVVTGASRGIGKAIAQKFAELGATVALVSRTRADLESVAQTITGSGGKATVHPCDIADGDSVAAVFKEIEAQHGLINILVNNAGITRDALLMRMRGDDWDLPIQVNLKGAFHCIKAVTRSMMKNRYGRIINISSVVGVMGNAGQANYAASKAGLIGLTKSMARELASRGITVNAIAPGYIATDMTADLADNVKEKLAESIPLGRLGQPEDIAPAVAFLASDAAAYITGQTLLVDGGMVM